MKKCNHSEADKINGKSKSFIFKCLICGKRIIKNKITKNKAFGIAKVLRTKEYGKNFEISYK